MGAISSRSSFTVSTPSSGSRQKYGQYESSDDEVGKMSSSDDAADELEKPNVAPVTIGASVAKEKTAEEKQKEQEDEERKRAAYKQIDVNEVWVKVEKTIDRSQVQKLQPAVKRSGWKTVRIFVSSTFRDFHSERDILVKKVFPDLRRWCESEERRLHLIECDLRWGVPKDSSSVKTLHVCLSEIDRCYEDNQMPYFINMTSERIGWIPLNDEIEDQTLAEEYKDKELRKDYKFVYGLSVTEMEIMHAAYRQDNPNSLFMIRKKSYLDTVDEKEKEAFEKAYKDEYPEIADKKLEMLKDKIESKFKRGEQVFYYEGTAVKESITKNGRPQLSLDDKQFADVVIKFFKERIEYQYPPVIVEEDPYVRTKEQHEAFMTARAEFVHGQKDFLEKIKLYLTDDTDVPLIISGGAGSGKSSIMASAVSSAITDTSKTLCKPIVFCHFVGAVPHSTDLEAMLRRLLKEMSGEFPEPKDFDEAVGLVQRCLGCSTIASRSVIVFVDAVNQFDSSNSMAEQVTWLPEKLAPGVRCVLSMISDSKCQQNLTSREAKPRLLTVPALSDKDKTTIVQKYLQQFNKELDKNQLTILLAKNFSHNPLWLTIACEELRVFGDFKLINNHIVKLAGDLEGLLSQVISRYAKEGDGHLLKATLCLIEVSKSGLLESELLEILADEENIVRKRKDENGDVVRGDKGFHRHECAEYRLPALKWVGVYRNLRTFIRPFGSPGEGRLSFYHQTLSTVIRKRYLKDNTNNTSSPKRIVETKDKSSTKRRERWWHRKLADYFDTSNEYDRKVEEYPHHLIALGKFAKLQKFLVDWKCFDRLYNSDHSDSLLRYWRLVSQTDEDYSKIFDGYKPGLEKLLLDAGSDTAKILDAADKYEKVSRLLVQAGRYDEATGLAEKSLKLMQERQRKDPAGTDYGSKLMYIYGHFGHIVLQKLPNNQTVKEIPQVEEIVQYHQKAIDILRTVKKPDKKTKLYLAVQLIKKAFGVASLVDRMCLRRNVDRTSEQVMNKLNDARVDIDEAEGICRELNDIGWLIEAYLTKATLFRGEHGKQRKIYDEAIEKCIHIYGKVNPVIIRLYFNKAIVYEDEARERPDQNSTENYGHAYDYYKKAYVVAKAVFGPNHTRTVKYRDLLREPTYLWFAERRQDNIDDLKFVD